MKISLLRNDYLTKNNNLKFLVTFFKLTSLKNLLVNFDAE